MRFVFVGSGSLAVLTGRMLAARRHEVVLIERDLETIATLREELDAGFIHGEGTRPAILREADPAGTDLLFCLTRDDQANIIASLVARSLGYRRVVTKIEDPELEHICAELGLAGRPYFVLAPGAGWPAKEWPPERFAQAGRLLAAGGAVVVVGSATDEKLCRRVAAAVDGASVWTGRPLGRVVALLAEANGTLANDSGIAHLSAALGRPTAAVFTGATDPALCRPLGPAGCANVFRADDPVEEIVAYLLRP